VELLTIYFYNVTVLTNAVFFQKEFSMNTKILYEKAYNLVFSDTIPASSWHKLLVSAVEALEEAAPIYTPNCREVIEELKIGRGYKAYLLLSNTPPEKLS
jgi:hypothetical protein